MAPSKVLQKHIGERAKQQLTGSKQRLEIIGKLSTPRVSWVHGDEDGARQVDGNVASFKEHVGGLRSYSALHSADLLPNDGQYLLKLLQKHSAGGGRRGDVPPSRFC